MHIVTRSYCFLSGVSTGSTLQPTTPGGTTQPDTTQATTQRDLITLPDVLTEGLGTH